MSEKKTQEELDKIKVDFFQGLPLTIKTGGTTRKFIHLPEFETRIMYIKKFNNGNEFETIMDLQEAFILYLHIIENFNPKDSVTIKHN